MKPVSGQQQGIAQAERDPQPPAENVRIEQVYTLPAQIQHVRATEFGEDVLIRVAESTFKALFSEPSPLAETSSVYTLAPPYSANKEVRYSYSPALPYLPQQELSSSEQLAQQQPGAQRITTKKREILEDEIIRQSTSISENIIISGMRAKNRPSGIPFSQSERINQPNILVFPKHVPAVLQNCIRGRICNIPSRKPDKTVSGVWSKIPVEADGYWLNFPYGENYLMSADRSAYCMRRVTSTLSIPSPFGEPAPESERTTTVMPGDVVTKSVTRDFSWGAKCDLVDRVRDLRAEEIKSLLPLLARANATDMLPDMHFSRHFQADVSLLVDSIYFDEPETFSRIVTNCSRACLDEYISRLNDGRVPRISERCLIAAISGLASVIAVDKPVQAFQIEVAKRAAKITHAFLQPLKKDELGEKMGILAGEFGRIANTAWHLCPDTSNDKMIENILGCFVGCIISGATSYAEAVDESEKRKQELFCDMVDACAAMLTGGLAATGAALAIAVVIPPVDAYAKRQIREWLKQSNLKESIRTFLGQTELPYLNSDLSRKKGIDKFNPAPHIRAVVNLCGYGLG